MAEWLALQTGNRKDSSSIPPQVKTYFLQESRVSNNTLVDIFNFI